jgi:hypothetical protein
VNIRRLDHVGTIKTVFAASFEKCGEIKMTIKFEVTLKFTTKSESLEELCRYINDSDIAKNPFIRLTYVGVEELEEVK